MYELYSTTCGSFYMCKIFMIFWHSGEGQGVISLSPRGSSFSSARTYGKHEPWQGSVQQETHNFQHEQAPNHCAKQSPFFPFLPLVPFTCLSHSCPQLPAGGGAQNRRRKRSHGHSNCTHTQRLRMRTKWHTQQALNIACLTVCWR